MPIKRIRFLGSPLTAVTRASPSALRGDEGQDADRVRGVAARRRDRSGADAAAPLSEAARRSRHELGPAPTCHPMLPRADRQVGQELVIGQHRARRRVRGHRSAAGTASTSRATPSTTSATASASPCATAGPGTSCTGTSRCAGASTAGSSSSRTAASSRTPASRSPGESLYFASDGRDLVTSPLESGRAAAKELAEPTRRPPRAA